MKEVRKIKPAAFLSHRCLSEYYFKKRCSDQAWYLICDFRRAMHHKDFLAYQLRPPQQFKMSSKFLSDAQNAAIDLSKCISGYDELGFYGVRLMICDEYIVNEANIKFLIKTLLTFKRLNDEMDKVDQILPSRSDNLPRIDLSHPAHRRPPALINDNDQVVYALRVLS